MQCVLIGNYGVANFGDEMLMSYFLDAYPEIQWTVVSANPQNEREVARLPLGIRSFLKGGIGKTLRVFKQADAVLFGGGSLFTDAESVFACFLWWMHARVALFFGTPVLLAHQGIGPFRTRVGEWFCKDILRKSAFISVRDQESQKRAAKLTESTKIVLTCDPVFCFLGKRKKNVHTKNVLIAIPRLNSKATFLHVLEEKIKEHHFSSVVIVSFQPDEKKEQEVITRLLHQLSIPASKVDIRSVDDVEAIFDGAAYVVSERFHGGIAALAFECPVHLCPQVSGDKIDALRNAPSKQEMIEMTRKGEEELRGALEKISTRARARARNEKKLK